MTMANCGGLLGLVYMNHAQVVCKGSVVHAHEAADRQIFERGNRFHLTLCWHQEPTIKKSCLLLLVPPYQQVCCLVHRLLGC